jgi:hypothetical protein
MSSALKLRCLKCCRPLRHDRPLRHIRPLRHVRAVRAVGHVVKNESKTFVMF